MRSRQLIVAVLPFVILPSLSLKAEPPTFRPLHVVLPDDPLQPSLKVPEIISNSCLGCHSVDMILNQPNFARPTWDAEVRKMMATYKAPVSAQDVDRIVDSLCQLKCPRP